MTITTAILIFSAL